MLLPPLIRATFFRRDNRFLVSAFLEDHAVSAHLADPGRLKELLRPGAALWLAQAEAGQGRKTSYDVWLVEHEGVLVCVNSRAPNQLLEEALRAGFLAGEGWNLRREVRLGESRIDFCLERPGSRYWVEAKSVNLVRDGLALFPDAPTLRGRKHMLALAEAAARGEGAAVAFVVQREDAQAFAPNCEVDPAFAEALLEAERRGVQLRAISSQVMLNEICLVREIPVCLGAVGQGRFGRPDPSR